MYLFRPKATKTTPGMPTILFGHENSIFDSRIFLCTPAETNKSKNLWQKKIPPGLIHQHETKKVVEQNDLAIRESILLKRTKKLTTKTLES